MNARWPERLWIVRHGESAGNVAAREAEAAGRQVVDVGLRDVDVPLSQLGEAQARALGRWFASLAEDERPEVVLASPYLRAQHTADLLLETAGSALADIERAIDERLREREFGILDRLTPHGVATRHPDQAEFRRILGKFYHRPPGGESWCDLILRLRSALDTIGLRHGGRRVLVVTHEVVVLCFRYLLENLTEQEILAIDRQGDVANCGVTEFAFERSRGKDGALVLRRYNLTIPLEAEGTPVTSAPDANVAARG